MNEELRTLNTLLTTVNEQLTILNRQRTDPSMQNIVLLDTAAKRLHCEVLALQEMMDDLRDAPREVEYLEGTYDLVYS